MSTEQSVATEPEADDAADTVEDLREDFEEFREQANERIEQLESQNSDLRAELDNIQNLANDAWSQAREARRTAESAAEVSDEFETLETELADLQRMVESFAGPVGERNSKEKRIADLRLAMVKQAKEARRADGRTKGVTKWWKEVRDILVTQGYEGFTKPTYKNTMDEAAKAEGFGKTTKTNDNGREVQAIRVNLDDLPADFDGKQFTTVSEEGRAENHPETTQNESTTR